MDDGTQRPWMQLHGSGESEFAFQMTVQYELGLCVACLAPLWLIAPASATPARFCGGFQLASVTVCPAFELCVGVLVFLARLGILWGQELSNSFFDFLLPSFSPCQARIFEQKGSVPLPSAISQLFHILASLLHVINQAAVGMLCIFETDKA